ncbi:MAG: hypothetical protein QOH24_2303, partial [Verrucomicrobiota bacterium]
LLVSGAVARRQMVDRAGCAAERIQQSQIRCLGGGTEGREVDGGGADWVAQASCLWGDRASRAVLTL